MVLRLIGTATTDNNGVAVLSNGYTGTGAGMVDFVASAEIDGGSVVSEPYEVLDAILYDTGVDSSITASDFYFDENSPSITVNDTGTLVENTGSGNRMRWAKIPYSTASARADVYDFAPSFVVEFDMVEFTGNVNLNIGDTGGDKSRALGLTTFGLTTNNHIRIEVTQSTIKYYVDDVEKTALAYSNLNLGTCHFGFVVQASSKVKYKDLKIYPL